MVADWSPPMSPASCASSWSGPAGAQRRAATLTAGAARRLLGQPPGVGKGGHSARVALILRELREAAGIEEGERAIHAKVPGTLGADTRRVLGRSAIPETPAVGERHEARSTRDHDRPAGRRVPRPQRRAALSRPVLSREVQSVRRLARRWRRACAPTATRSHSTTRSSTGSRPRPSPPWSTLACSAPVRRAARRWARASGDGDGGDAVQTVAQREGGE